MLDSGAHLKTEFFRLALSAFSSQLSAKDIKNKDLADRWSLTAESSIQKLAVSGWKLNRIVSGISHPHEGRR